MAVHLLSDARILESSGAPKTKLLHWLSPGLTTTAAKLLPMDVRTF
jgi:hypothetical protein